MRRLIEGTTQAFSITNYILDRKDTFIRALEKGDNDFLFGLLIDYFCDQPTAYDVDRVVEQLENLQDKAVNVRNADLSIYATGMMGKAINIVKAGGIE